MDIIRRNTDYALRIMVSLASDYGGQPLPASNVAKQTLVAYPLTCKLLQKLAKAKLVQSSMGPKGGFSLIKEPGQINLGQIIEVIQGPVNMNKCLLGDFRCERRKECTLYDKLSELQEQISDSLTSTTLEELLTNKKRQLSKEGKK
jgi:Rrf2 family protein